MYAGHLAFGLAVFSHFLPDLPMHPADLAIYSHPAIHSGLGLHLANSPWRTPH